MPAKKRPRPNRRRPKQPIRRLGFGQRLAIFTALFAVTGSFLLYSTKAATPYADSPPHHSACIQNTPSKTFVKPGERFSATVKMRNDGTSTYSSSYGVYLGEFNGGNVTNTWNAQGTGLSGSVGPGGTATFNLTLTAPAAIGTYNFNWAMVIALNGVMHNPCSGQSVTVTNPPAITLNANNQGSNIALTTGNGLTLTWSATGNPTSCNAFGNWGGAKPSAGSENRTGDTASSGTRTYNLTCANAVGSTTASRSVTVNSPPPRPGTSNPPPRPGGTTSPGTTPRPSTSPPSNPSTPDTSPPTAPADLTAEVVNDSTIALTWASSSDNVEVKGYQVERSSDQQNWTILGENPMIDTAYTDKDGGFATTYYYRVRAVDTSGNNSDYAVVDATTNTFSANAGNDEAAFVTSENGTVSASIPTGALDAAAQCSLTNNNSLLPPVKAGYSAIAGPMELLCKIADGTVIDHFAKPVTINIKLSDRQKKQYRSLAYFVHDGDWKAKGTSGTKQVSGFTLTDQTNFVIMGVTKKTPLWQKLLVVILILIIVIGGGLVLIALGLRFRRRQVLKAQARDYYNKEHGF